jgi:hypothetical protein
MGSSSSAGGVVLIVFGVLVASEIISKVTGIYSHWLFVLPGLLIGMLTARSIR